MYTADFDNSGAVKQILTCYNKDTAYPLVLRHDLISVIPHLKKKYLQYEQYKQQRIEDIFTPAELNRAVKMEAYTLQSAVLINNRKGGFTMEPLPAAAQFSPMYGMVVADYDGDGKTDILMGGNFYQSKPEAGIYDASYGTLLKGDGKGHFSALTAQQSGIRIRGAVRDMTLLKAGNRQLLLAAMSNEAVKVLVVNSLPLTHHQAASPQR